MKTTKGNVRENQVVEFDDGRRIAWKPAEPGQEPLGHLWRWELEPLGASRTRVTHTYDWTHSTDEKRFPRARATTADKLQASLDRLATLAAASDEGPEPPTTDAGAGTTAPGTSARLDELADLRRQKSALDGMPRAPCWFPRRGSSALPLGPPAALGELGSSRATPGSARWRPAHRARRRRRSSRSALRPPGG